VTGRDADLVSDLRSGDESAFARLVDLWSPAMLSVARSFVRSHASAEDVVQETWIAVLDGLASFRGDASLRTWTFRILANQARRRGRDDARIVPAETSTDDPSYPPSSFRDAADPWPGHWRSNAMPADWGPEDQVLSREALAAVQAALAELPDRQRVVVELRDVHDLSSAEVCEVLAISPQNQRVLLHRGRTRVRRRLAALLTGEEDR